MHHARVAFGEERGGSIAPIDVHPQPSALGHVGDRVERSRGRSEISGEFVVEDVQVGKDTFRRLVFMNNRNLTQSEAKIKSGKEILL